MKLNLSCTTVKDLLPTFLDGIASEETNTSVKKHLSECQLCKSEHNKLCNIQQKNKNAVEYGAASIKKLQNRIKTSFIITVILGIFLISIAMFCSYGASGLKPFDISDAIFLLVLYVGIYFIPLLGIFIGFIWKQIISKREDAFWPNVFISFLGIWLLTLVIFLLWRFILVIMLIN